MFLNEIKINLSRYLLIIIIVECKKNDLLILSKFNIQRYELRTVTESKITYTIIKFYLL